MKIRKLETNTPGTLVLHSMPGRNEDLGAFIERAQEEVIAQIICLTSDEEIKDKSPDYFQAIQQGGFPVPRTAFPIPDFGPPNDTAAYYALVESVAERLRNGENVLVHCAGGVGRTGMFAGCVLKALDLPLILLEKSGSYPEAEEQLAVVRAMPLQNRK